MIIFFILVKLYLSLIFIELNQLLIVLMKGQFFIQFLFYLQSQNQKNCVSLLREFCLKDLLRSNLLLC